MARKKFEEGFKENAIEYCQIHSDKTIKACAADLGIGYSTLRRWIAQSQEATAPVEAVEVSTEAEAGKEDSASIVEQKQEESQVEAEKVRIDDVSEVEKDTNIEAKAEESHSMVEVDETNYDDVIDSSALDFQVEAVQEELDDEFDWVNKRDQMKSQLGGLIESAGNGVSDAVQLIGLYKKRHELKKVQKKLKKEKEKRMK